MWMDLCFILCWLQPLKENISVLWANVLAKHLCNGCQTHHLNPAMSPNSAAFSGNPTYLLFQIISMERKHMLTYSLLCNSGHRLHLSPDGVKWDHILLRPSGSPALVSTHVPHCICSLSAFRNDFPVLDTWPAQSSHCSPGPSNRCWLWCLCRERTWGSSWCWGEASQVHRPVEVSPVS